jgi:hypothetical protein
VQDGVPVVNKQAAKNLLTVNLPDGHQVQSTHTCNVVVPGLLSLLVGHIIPNLAIASLFGIRPLSNTGCIVVFHIDRVEVWYNGKLILIGPQNLMTDLWTLPSTTKKCNMKIPPAIPQPIVPDHPAIAFFTHSIRTRMNAVQFTHQLLGNPCISTLLKAVRHGFLNGCPNMSEKLVLKYLNPSPATAKGHMKGPRHGIQSTTPKSVQPLLIAITAAPT